MYAVVKTGGKQYKVAENDILTVERIPGEAGSAVVLDEVLAVDDGKTAKIGAPTVAGTVVSAEIVEQKRGDKIIVFKKKRRQGYRRTQGHRQELTVLKITGIGAGKKPAAQKTAAQKPAAKKPAAKTAAAATTAAKAPTKKPAAKPATKTTAAKKATPAKPAAAKKPAAKTAAAAKTTAAKKPAAKKAPAKKPAAKKTD
ncbi:MAG: 50S ribosomal protein L21 [Sphingomonadales bacterium]|nr:50S ribosomal protein L21 [Sphingomonadales bacterium]